MNAQLTAPARTQSGISLLEVILIFAVIAVAITLLFPAFTAVRDHGPRTKAPHTIRNIAQAILLYKEDHGHFPQVAEPRNASEQFMFVGDSAAGCKESNGVLFDVLRAIRRGLNADDALNPKRVRYFEDAIASDPKMPRDGFTDGKAFSTALQGCLFDSWGSQYCIVMGTNCDETLDLGNIYADLAGPKHAIHFAVVAFSLGKDRLLGGEKYRGSFRCPQSNEAPEDIVSWQ